MECALIHPSHKIEVMDVNLAIPPTLASREVARRSTTPHSISYSTVQETDAGSQYTELVLPRNASTRSPVPAQPELEQHSQLARAPFPSYPVQEWVNTAFQGYRGML